MKKLLLLILLLLLLTGCSSLHLQFQSLNTAAHYTSLNTRIINNEFELDRLLRNDFNFRYNFSQYALTQPLSFDWRFNRYTRFNRYNRFNSYYGYNYSPWDRHQMWNDWVWDYPYRNNMWRSYNWNNRYRRNNVVHHSRRTTPVNTNRRRVNTPRVTPITTSRRVIRNVNNTTIRTQPVRRTRTVRVNTPTRTTRIVSNRTQPTRKVNSRRKN